MSYRGSETNTGAGKCRAETSGKQNWQKGGRLMKDTILAVVVTRETLNKVQGMNSIFIAEDYIEQQRIALLLSRILKAMSHDLENGVMIIVQH
jgi:hypothetical protein